MDKNGLGSDEICNILCRYAPTHSVLRGVYARDEFREALNACISNSAPGAFVINTDTSNKPGEHWLAIFYNAYKQFEFFDSYGLPPSIYGLRGCDFVRRNEQRVQGMDTKSCGYHCIYYITQRVAGVVDPYMHSFSAALAANAFDSIDRDVERLVKRLHLEQRPLTNAYCTAAHQHAIPHKHYRDSLVARGVLFKA
jgi:hypothetical protein